MGAEMGESKNPAEEGKIPVEEGKNPVVEGRNPAEEGENPAEEGKSPTEEGTNLAKEEITFSRSTSNGQQLQHLAGAMLDKEQIHQLGVAEGETASKKLPLRKNKDKRSELMQVKKEKQLGSYHKTQLPAVAEEPKEDVREEPASECLRAMLNREKNHLLDVVSVQCIRQAFGDNAAEHLEKVDMTMKSLFKDYSLGESFVNPSEEVDVDEVAEIDNPLADWEAHLRVQKKQATNELDRYLSEDLYPQEKDFDILGWWKLHSPEYPVLSCIARDVLAIQASTVASESSFSAGGRTISDQRNRLKSDTVEALICLQDWLKADDPKTTNKDVEEEEYLVFYQESECHEETEPTDN